MPQERRTAGDWVASNVKDVVGVSAEQVKETSKASLDASRAVMEIYRESAVILRDRSDEAFRTGMAVMEAGFDANVEQFNRMVAAKNLQDVLRVQMMWGANQTLAMSHALSRARESQAGAGSKFATA